jgi:hypothetical protein
MSPSFDARETRPFAFEMKFLVDASSAESIRRWARGRLDPDPHGAGAWSDEYLITSIYFDTPAYDVLRQRASNGRMKFRVRRYGDSEVVYLERKLRNARLLSKRRTTIEIADLPALPRAAASADHPAGWFSRRLQLRQLAPVCQVSYRRTARVAESAFGPVRLTIDDDIRAQAVNGLSFAAGPGVPVLDGFRIVELKYRFAMPAVFKHLVEEFALTPLAISKYRVSAPIVCRVEDPPAALLLRARAASPVNQAAGRSVARVLAFRTLGV